ncbi:MAG: YhdP family protein [Sulfurisoma sp.]|nr:YhdP family protein [Sulfurisoma sp.]
MLGWTVGTLYFAFALLVLVLRYAILPQIESYRPDIERALSTALRQSVAIRRIEAGWQGLRPSLTLSGIELRDAANRPALTLDHVEADLGWSSLLYLAPRLHRLEIASPRIDVRRDPAGKLFVAGLEIDTRTSDANFSDWLLAQDRVIVRDAAITWHDELRGAPPLALTRLNFDLRNSGNRHRFGLTAEPPRHLAARIDLRGDFKGKDLDLLDSWKGEAYAELDYADLAGWRAWVDYPVELSQGSGALRLWLGFAAKRLTSLAADVRLANVQIRLAKDLPLLELDRVEGRFAGKRFAEGYEAEAKQLTLQARSGTRIEPTDFRLRWDAPAANRAARGEFSANGLDLAALTDLAAHLPLDASVRQKLANWAPRGRLLDLASSWSGPTHEGGALLSWKVKGRFEGLGLAAQGELPGFSGVSGTVAGDEKGGTLELASRQVVVEMPAIFAEPRLELETLSANTAWQAADGRIVVNLKKAEFQNRDAAGELVGSYRTAKDGPGEIDLSGKLTRAAGAAVWRYMPLGVNKDVRDWLHTSLIGGQASEATLRLKGDLKSFPFRDGKSGVFEIKGRFRGATLKFAEGWPDIRGVDGELLFEGVRMLIKGTKGTLLGVNVSAVSAEIPDLETHEEQLNISGKVAGPTTEFLKFIEASPVGERIDHFTAPMVAVGNGDLDLKLALPLRHLDQTRVDGRYRFANNRVTVDADLPPLTDVNGELRFTADRLEARMVRASMLGAPMTLDIATAGQGLVTINAAGSVSVRELRQQFEHPALEHLSGVAPWSGTVRARKHTVEARIESSLKGIASSLPAPFNKSATEARPLVLERRAAPEVPKAGAAPRDQLLLSYGDAVRGQIVRRHEAKGAVVERGVIAIGLPPRLPEQGLLLAAELETLDVDFWRRLLKNGNGGTVVPVSEVALHAEELFVHGRSFSDFRVNATRSNDTWRAEVAGNAFAGKLDWSGEGAGRLSGRMSRVTVPESVTSVGPGDSEEPTELPAINLVIDRFSLRGKDFGEVKLQAENREGLWHARMDVKNEDGALSGQGRWRPHVSAPLTQFDFKLEAKSVEKLLARVGYPQAVKRGTATLEGSLNWAGSPLTIDYPSLSGKLKLDAANGQFSKLEPGVGRLIGVLSLQSLPRRIVLDFRDVFSEGFAFDSINGESTVTRGILETKDMEIVGPSARVILNGSVNLPSETQNLKVRVQPALGETVALGAVLANPAIGAVTWLAQKLFKDPFGRVFAFEYNVTGGWADPKVEKVGSEKVGAGETAKEPARAGKP